MNDISTKSNIHSSYINLEDGTVPWFHYDRVPSTMDLAFNMVKKGVVSWTVVSACNQSEGRGTKGRMWVSHSGQGLWCSIILPPPAQPSDMATVTLLAAESLVKTLQKWVENGVTIKHPNDVLLNGRKIAGILCESVILDNVVRSLILGMGVNLLQNRGQFEKEGLTGASSLASETGKNVDIFTFLQEFLLILKQDYDKNILYIRDEIIDNHYNGGMQK